MKVTLTFENVVYNDGPWNDAERCWGGAGEVLAISSSRKYMWLEDTERGISVRLETFEIMQQLSKHLEDMRKKHYREGVEL